MKNIFIRADANEIIATGHIMRTSAVAYALKNLGVNPSLSQPITRLNYF